MNRIFLFLVINVFLDRQLLDRHTSVPGPLKLAECSQNWENQELTVQEVSVQQENCEQQGVCGPGSDSPRSVGPGTDGPRSVVIPSDYRSHRNVNLFVSER